MTEQALSGIAHVVALSPMQQGMLFHTLFTPDSGLYVEQVSCEMENCDADALRKAWDRVIARHEALRSAFVWENVDKPLQAVYDSVEAPWKIEDWRSLDESEQERRFEKFLAAERSRGFEVDKAPLMRFSLFRASDTRYKFVWTHHHLLLDGWSLRLVFREVLTCYEAAISGAQPTLPPTRPYRAFVDWVERQDRNQAVEFWRSHLKGIDEEAFSSGLNFASSGSGNAIECRRLFSPALTAQLEGLARDSRITLNTVLQGAWALLLSRYSCRSNVVFGTTVSVRPAEIRDVESMAGLLINTIPVSISVASDKPLFSWLSEIQASFAAAEAHAWYPLPDIQTCAGVPGGVNLFDSLLVFENTPSEKRADAATPFQVRQFHSTFRTNYPLTLVAGVHDGQLHMSASIDSTRDANMAERLLDQIENLLASFASSPEQRIGAVLLLGNEEEAEQRSWNETSREYPQQSLRELFAETVAAHREDLAGKWSGGSLTYGELNARANRLAWHLRERGVGPESLVGLSVEEGRDAVLGMLAVVKAGGAYVPLRPEDPRRGEMVERLRREQGMRWLVVSGEKPEFEGVQAISLLGDAEAIAVRSDTDPPLRTVMEQLAYVIHTSGSTGIPKGIAVTHAGVVRLVRNTDYLQAWAGLRLGQISTYAFDAATFEVWGALLNGGCLVEVPREVKLWPKRLAEWLRDEQIDAMFLTAALFNQVVSEVPQAFGGMHTLLVGGEALTAARVREVLEAGGPRHLLNGYGPTECTTFALWHPLRLEDTEGSVPIGRPLANTEAWVLGAHLQRQPVGVLGEIGLGGPGVARCYLGDARRTAERFVPHPCAQRPGERLYLTGDWGRWRRDGVVEYAGRRDGQIKLRGFRIEPGEIEAALKAHPKVRDAVVALREGKLCAWTAVEDGVTEADLRQHLESRLPSYMLPAAIAILPSLPLNHNGKIERHKLPEISFEKQGGPLPRTDAEFAIAEVWQSVLRRPEPIALHTNYFSAGGDSITAIQIVSRLVRNGWNATLQNLHLHPTIEGFAATIQRSSAMEDRSEDRGTQVPFALGPAQSWFFAHHRGRIDHFNQSVMLASSAPLLRDALQKAIDLLADEHEMLRARFCIEPDGEVKQWIAPPGSTALQAIDLSGASDQQAALENEANRIQSSLDLEKGPVFRAALISLGKEDRLLLTAHHLVVDGVSWRILLEDLGRVYEDIVNGNRIVKRARSTSYARWIGEVARCSTLPAFLSEADYWRNLMAEKPAREFRAPRERYGSMQSVTVSLTPAETEMLLTEPARALGASTEEALLAAFAAAFRKHVGESGTWVDLEGHGRQPLDETAAGQHWDTSRTVGWFTSLFPFRLATTDESPVDRLLEMKEALRSVPRKGAGYGVLRYVARTEIEWVQPTISFNYLGQFGGGEKGGLHFASDSPGQMIDPDLESPHDLDVVALVSDGQMLLTFHFQPSCYSPEVIERVAVEFRKQIVLIASTCRAVLRPVRTPADFAVPCLSLTRYRKLLDANGWDDHEVEDIYPLSPLQSGLLFESLSAPDRQAYFIQVSYGLRGRLDLDRFEQSWQYLKRRHAVLRTSFVHEGLDEPLQVVFRERALPVRSVDLSGLDEEAQLQRTLALEAQDLARGFDLSREPLMRITVAILGPEKYRVIWSYHHLLLDGWCLGLLHQDLLDFYSHGHADRGTSLPYSSYIRWLRSQDPEQALAFWADYLAEHEGIQGPPRDVPGGTPRREQHSFFLSEAESGALQRTADRLCVTLNSVLQAIWSALLSRYCGTEDCVFGTVVSGRPSQLPGVESTVGLFINALPVRARVERGKHFSQLARELQEHAAARELYQFVPLAEIQKINGGPLFDHMLTFENYPLNANGNDEAGDGDELHIESSVRAHDRTHYDFGLTIVPGTEIEFRLDYDAAQFSRELVELFTAHWREAAELICANPDIKLADFDFLPANERELLIRGFQPKPAPKATSTAVARIREQATTNAHETALVCESRHWPYEMLDQASDRIAAGLRRRGIQTGSKIALLLDRSEWLVASVLGILKAGCAFVPIEPDTPPERIRFIVADAGAGAVLVNPGYELLAGDTILCIDPATFENEPITALQGPAGDMLAYVIYTSGSTGKPKGCQVTHANLYHYLSWALDYYFGASGCSFPLFTPLSFDLTITSLFLPLMCGRTLHVFPNKTLPGDVLAEVLRPDSGIDAVKLTPSHMSLIEDSGCETTGLRVMIAGGEALPLERVRTLQQLNRNLAIYNEYGPTETTVGCIVRKIEPDDRRVLIGSPITNTVAYVVDERLRLCPVGVAGEILIGGAGVSRGYINRDDLNAEKFIHDPFRPDETVYRSGDLGRWLPGGQMEYLGRVDDQVKIRGFRIEPAEIVRCLGAEPQVGKCAVVPDSSRSRLLAFYTGSADPGSLRQKLRDLLPEYMVPSTFTKVDEIPVTRNGKTDKAALLRIFESHQPRVVSTATEETPDPVEAEIIAIWRVVLGVDVIGLDTDFFEAGGHSLRAMQALSRIQQRLGVRIPLPEILHHPTPRGLAIKVRASDQHELEPIPTVLWQPDYPLSNAQQRLWSVNQWDTGAVVAHNMHHAFRLEGKVDTAALERAFQAVIDRHDSLRTGFTEVGGEPRQRIEQHVDFRLEDSDLRSESDAHEKARRIVARDSAAAFDAARPPLIRARLIRVAEDEVVLSLVMHHLVGDGWSMTILFNEVVALYCAFCKGASSSLPPLRIQYKDFVAWQLRQPIREAERFWLEKLDGVPQEIRLPWDIPPGGERDFRGAVHSCSIGLEITEKLEALARRHGTTLARGLLSVLAAWLYAWTRQEDFCIGVSVAGRNHPDTEGLIGFFVNMLPIRIRPSREKDFEALLEEVQEACEQAIERQHYPFDRLVQVLNPERVMNRQPLVNVVYSFQNFNDIRTSAKADDGDAGIRIEEFERNFTTSKFDLTFFASRTAEGLNLDIEYDTGLFRASTIAQGAVNIQRFATAIAGENAS